MAEERLVVTDNDVRDPNLLLRFLRIVVAKFYSLGNRISSIESSPRFPSFNRISQELGARGSAPLNIGQLPGVAAQPQLALAPRLAATPTGLVLQQYQDQQLLLVGSGSAFDLYTVVGGNPTTAVKITPSGSPHNFLSATHTDTVAAAPVLGDIVYGNATPAWTKLAGNITTTTQFLAQIGTGAVSAAPVWISLGLWTDYTPTTGASAGTYTAGVVTCHAIRLNKELVLSVLLNAGNVSATPANLTVTLPATLTAAKVEGGDVTYSDNGTVGHGWVETTAGSNVLKVYKAIDHSGTWAVSAGVTTIGFNLSLEIQ